MNINSTIKQYNKKSYHVAVYPSGGSQFKPWSRDHLFWLSHFHYSPWYVQTNSLMAHYKKLLLLSFAQCHVTYIKTISSGTSRQTLWWHITKSYCRYLLHSATSLTLRQYPENVSISLAHLAHFEHQLLVCDVWDCHDVIYAHHPFYIPCTPQTALLNQEYMSEFISTNTYMIHTKCRITNTVHNPVWQY